MALPQALRQRMRRVLETVDDHGTRGSRLVDDATRLWDRVRRLAAMNLIGPDHDVDALELACYALQLPMRDPKLLGAGRLGRTNLRERAEQAAELLVTGHSDEIDEPLLDRATRLLQELPHRPPVVDEAKLLADAVNLDDFGVTGLMQQMVQLTRSGEGISQLDEGSKKREQYGYWDARLKDLNFEPVRKIARQRLQAARQVAALLSAELNEDGQS